MNIKMIPFDFVCHKYTQILRKNSPTFDKQNINMIVQFLFLLFKKSKTFWDSPRTFIILSKL